MVRHVLTYGSSLWIMPMQGYFRVVPELRSNFVSFNEFLILLNDSLVSELDLGTETFFKCVFSI